MHREWRHEVSERWLMSRKSCLTASDVKRLVSDHNKMKAGKIRIESAQQFAKVYGEKQSMDMDPMSYGSMARGHIMEPYAVEEADGAVKWHWWDDRLITDGVLGFSPDAMDIPQMGGTRFNVDEDTGEIIGVNGRCDGPKALLEIKSYEAGGHYQKMAQVSSGSLLEERWQVATAMAVCPTITEAKVMFYAPQCGSSFSKRYDREDLEKNIDIVKSIGEEWKRFSKIMDDARKRVEKSTIHTEEDIYNRYLLDDVIN